MGKNLGKADPVAALRRIPDRPHTLTCERCGAIDEIEGGGTLPYCSWDYVEKEWIVEPRRCHCRVGASNHPNLSLYDDGRWSHLADDHELCVLRELEVNTGRGRFEVWDVGRKFLKGRKIAEYEPVRDPRGLDWFRGEPKPEWQNPDWKGEDGDGG